MGIPDTFKNRFKLFNVVLLISVPKIGKISLLLSKLDVKPDAFYLEMVYRCLAVIAN